MRDFADKFSDLEIIVFLSKKDDEFRRQIRKTGLHEEQCSGVYIDLEMYLLSDFAKWKSDEIDMWDFSKSEIVSDPSGEVGKLFGRKLHISESLWVKRIAVYAEYLK